MLWGLTVLPFQIPEIRDTLMCKWNLQAMCSALLFFLPSSCCIIRQGNFEILKRKCKLTNFYTLLNRKLTKWTTVRSGYWIIKIYWISGHFGKFCKENQMWFWVALTWLGHNIIPIFQFTVSRRLFSTFCYTHEYGFQHLRSSRAQYACHSYTSYIPFRSISMISV